MLLLDFWCSNNCKYS